MFWAALGKSLSRLSGGKDLGILGNIGTNSLSRLSGGKDPSYERGVRSQSLSRLSGGKGSHQSQEPY